MKHIEIKFKNNGYVVVGEDFAHLNGEYVYKATEEIKLLEDLGLALLEKKVQVKEK